MQSLIWYTWIFLNLTKMDRRQNEKKFISTVFYPLSILYFWCNIFAKKKKQSQLLFSILNNYNIYKLFRITNTQTHTHSQTHASTCILISGLYWMLVKAMNAFRAHDQKRETHFPSSHRSSWTTVSLLPSISSCRAHCIGLISFYNLFLLKLKALKSISRHDFPHIFVILVVESSFTY